MKIKEFLLFILFVFLFVGLVSGVEVSNDTSSHYSEAIDTFENEVYSSVMPENGIDTVEDMLSDKSVVRGEVQDKEMETEEKIVKNEISNVTCYQDLVYAFEEAEVEEYDNLLINLLPGDYSATANITWNNSATKNIILNGNDNILDGEDLYSFIEVGEGHNLTLENITLTDYVSRKNGIVCNYGTLSIFNCTFSNTKVKSFAGAVYNEGNLTVSDTVFQNNSGINGKTIYNKKGNATVTNSTFCNTIDAINNNNGSVNITDCIFNNNTGASGTVYNSYGDLMINNCTFNNNVGYDGAATFNWKGIVIINDSTFNNNSATGDASSGGAINNYEESILNITNCIFNNNNATHQGGAIISRGRLDINNCTFNNNSATHDGGAIFSRGSSNITDSIFNNNSATRDGGAIYSGSTLIICNTTFNNNNVKNDDESELNSNGGSIYSMGNLTIINSSFYNNYALVYGGAIFSPNILVVKNTTFYNNFAGNYGGAIYSSYNLIVNGSTFNNNTAGNDGGAIFALNNYEINDTIFYKNAPIDFFINETNQIEPRTFNEDPGNDNYYRVCRVDVNDFSIIVDGVEAYHGYGLEDLSRYVISPDSLTVDLILNSTVENHTRTNNIFALRKSKEVNVECYMDLLNVIEDAKNDNEYSNYEINLMCGDYNATESINLADSNISNITINGNGITLDGQNSYQFIQIGSDFNLTLENIVLTNYMALEGGAINNMGTLSIINSTLKNNNANYFGGAVYNYGNLTLTDCTFQDNYADNGGAIINYGNSIINGSTFKYNNATHGSAITNFENISIEENTFITNKANDTGKAILDFKGNAIIRDNKNDDTSKYSSTIYTVGRTVIITNNVFYDELNTTITISTNNTNPKVNEKIKISFLLKDQFNNTIASENVNITINNEEYNIITDNIGVASLEYIPRNKTLNINATYLGNHKYVESRVNTSFNVEKQDITIIIDPITDIKYDNNLTITGQIRDMTGEELYDIIALITINDKVYEAKTDKTGVFRLTITAEKIGTNTVTITFNGNEYYTNTTTKTTFTVEKQTSSITINKIPDRTYSDTVTISGTLTDENNKTITNQEIIITINNKPITITTDNNGTYTHNTIADKIGTNNITITYQGNEYYTNTTTKTTFTVEKIDTIITINVIGAEKYADEITISGTLKDTKNNNIQDNITLTINNNTITISTDKTGTYTYKTSANTIGTNTIKAEYKGNNQYTSTNTEKTFTIRKQTSSITINKIKTKKIGDQIIITGTLKDENNKTITNQEIKITINNKPITITTDNNGTYTHNTIADKIGTNNITITYQGNKYYTNTTTTATFTVEKQDTKITTNKITTITYEDNITIKGKLTTTTGKTLSDTNIKITINKEPLTIKTDKNGEYTYTTTATTIGTNNITISYQGNINYNPSNTQTTFTVEKLDTKITINKITTTEYTETINITGKLTDKNGKNIGNTNIKLNINGKNITTKTDTKGTYTYKYQTDKVGTNNINISYTGNTNYNPSNTQTTFKVDKQKTKITINNIKAAYSDNITLTGKLTDKNGKNIGNTNIKLNINGKNITTKTDTKGVFSYKYQTNKLGTNNLTVIFNGNTNYASNTTKTTFKVDKQDLKLTISKLNSTAYGENLTIKGTFKDKNGKILGNTILRINVNGKTVKVKTNTKGIYTKTIKTDKTGTNNITVSYPGNKNYNTITKKATVNITRQNLTITVNNTQKVGYGSKVYIKGQLTDKHGKIIKNTVITININGKTIRTKTNSKGIYNHSLTTSKLGKNNITVSYPGNKNYNSITQKATFTVIKQTVKISITGTRQVTGTKNVTITGKLTTKDGKILKNSQVTLTINDKKKTAKTNTNGIFTLTTQGKKGNNTLIPSFNGNNYYNKYTGTEKTFKIQ